MKIGYLHGAHFFENFFKRICSALHYQLTSNPKTKCDIIFYSFNQPRTFTQATGNSKIVYISGEPTNSAGKKCDLIIDTKDVPSLRPRGKPFLYMPYYALAFFSNGISHRPEELIKSFPFKVPQKTKFCAFMYSYDVPHRVRLFDEISKYKRVDGLGKSRKNVAAPQTRGHVNYVDDAVNRYRPYKFVIACENTIQNGYITEKLIVPMLAGCIPIYYGSPDVAQRYFNTKSFINISSFPNLQAAIEYIKKVDNDPELYQSILNEPWFTSNQLPPYFSIDYALPSLRSLANIKSIRRNKSRRFRHAKSRVPQILKRAQSMPVRKTTRRPPIKAKSVKLAKRPPIKRRGVARRGFGIRRRFGLKRIKLFRRR